MISKSGVSAHMSVLNRPSVLPRHKSIWPLKFKIVQVEIILNQSFCFLKQFALIDIDNFATDVSTESRR